MATEIERKFLVGDDRWRATADAGTPLRQGYLCEVPERTVRVRTAGDRAFLTIKGKTVGASRSEFEYAIPVADAEALLTLCVPPLIEKTRYRVAHASHIWEIDVFAGANAGLILAEVELRTEAEAVALPDWAGTEVTTDPRYYNVHLRAHPYRTWQSDDG